MADDRVSVSITDGIADVRMNRADKRNALDGPMFTALAAAGERLKSEPTVRVVVLSGEGASFCAGLDMGAMAGLANRSTDPGNPGLIQEGQITHLGQQVAWVWQELPVPVIAAVHGHAIGGGIQIALGADIRIVHPDTKLSVREVHWGIVPDMTGTLMLAQLVGSDVAKELVMTARTFDGREAHALGLATKLSENPYDDAIALANEIAARNPDAIRATKALLNGLFNRGAAEQFAAERRYISGLVGQPNQVEAVMANFEQRPAVLVIPSEMGTPTTPAAEPNSDALKFFSFQVFSKLEGAVTAGMIHLGDQLGLYSALHAAGHPLSSEDLAGRTGLNERWVREWAHNQAAAKLITIDESHRFGLTPEAAIVFASPEHPYYGMGMFHRLPQTMQALDHVRDSFRTGIGRDYDSHGPQGAVGIERSFEPWSNANLLPVVLPALEGTVERLRVGANVVDVGCGAGSAVLLMAAAFPQSTFRGYDISQFALERARQKLSESSVTNASFHDPRESPMPTDHSVDLVTTFDCIHDMTQPGEMMHALRQAISPNGTWLLVDIKALDTFEENARKNPMASLMYGISVLSCMSSALSEPGGEGLGTLGLPESRAREMASAAGFTRFRRLDIEHSVNAFYEVRP